MNREQFDTHEQHMQAHKEALRYFSLELNDVVTASYPFTWKIQIWFKSLRSGKTYKEEKIIHVLDRLTKIEKHIRESVGTIHNSMGFPVMYEAELAKRTTR